MSGSAKGRARPRRPASTPARGASAAARKKPAGLSPVARRWAFVGAFTLALLVGLPLAHAMLGDAGAILLGTFAFGFVVGRMTIRR
ncbi:hypothetical protein [Roseomonas sp. HF4]|uniref:hypothetical protein n=1 Tax=Roseomonas sp. HF4 TaxID=2562313 RepID=UPI0010C0E14A|nr:hypothetical protein [Roseomonas sp. HF4]